jgi:hypothetical protein
METDFPDIASQHAPGKEGLGFPRWAESGQGWPKLAKLGQKWTRLAKSGQGWPKLDSRWTSFPAVLWRWEHPAECQAKTPALFLACLRGSASGRPFRSGNETTKKRPQKPSLSKIGRMPIDAVQADGTCGRDFETRLDE